MVCYYKTKRGNKSLAPLLLLLMTVLQLTVREALDEFLHLLNDQFYVSAMENGYSRFHQLSVIVGKRYYKIVEARVESRADNVLTANNRAVYCFICIDSGAIYKSASWAKPAKGIRSSIYKVIENPSMADAYGSWLYCR